MPIQKTLNKGKVPVKIFTHDIDSAAMTQLPLANSSVLFVYVERCVVTTLLRYVWSRVESQSHGPHGW